MNKYTEDMHLNTDDRLEKLLAERRAPLSEEGMRLALTDLTMYLTGNINFLAVLYPVKEKAGDTLIHAQDIFKADIMEGTDGERYLPVFTDLSLLKAWKHSLKDEEFIYITGKRDLLDFLERNEKVAAAVVNPGKDDLILYRMQLQNMIQIGSGNIR